MSDRPSEPGDPLAVLMPQVYDHLCRLARSHLRRERGGHTLEPSALVNEVYLKLKGQAKLDVRGRTHFLALSATAMRQVLVDHARQRATQKRRGDAVRVTLDESVGIADSRAQDMLDLHRALEKLADLDPVEVRIVEMRFFAGLTEVEVARELGISERTVRNLWSHARAWLRRELS